MSSPTQTPDDLLFWARVQHILEAAVASLTPADVAARVAWCREHGAQGVTGFDEPGGRAVRFEWGGRTLVVVDRDVFAADAYLEPLRATLLPAAPDDASALTGE